MNDDDLHSATPSDRFVKLARIVGDLSLNPHGWKTLFASAAGLRASTFSKVLRRERELPPGRVRDVAVRLGIPAELLYSGTLAELQKAVLASEPLMALVTELGSKPRQEGAAFELQFKPSSGGDVEAHWRSPLGDLPIRFGVADDYSALARARESLFMRDKETVSVNLKAAKDLARAVLGMQLVAQAKAVLSLPDDTSPEEAMFPAVMLSSAVKALLDPAAREDAPAESASDK